MRSRSRVRVYMLLYALGLVVRCPAVRFVQKATLAFFQLVAEHRNVDPCTTFIFIFDWQHHQTIIVVAKKNSPITDWLIS